LTGVTLIHTGAYHASGKMTRRGTNTKFSELAATSGESDIRGAVSIETSSGRPKLVAELNSQFLRTADLGARAAGRDSDSAAGAPLLLSNAALDPSATRRGDAIVNYHSRRLDIGRIPLQGVAATMAIDHGVLVVAPLLASVFEGKLTARVRLDASTDNPAAELDLKIADLQLERYFRDAAQPPADGLLRARVIVKGRGSSVHQVAASSNGTVTAVLSHGTIRSSLAELTGIDLRGLGMLLGKSAQSTPIRCAIASFQAHDGNLAAQSLIVDTEPVLVTGEGVIHMDSESLDLTLRGHPKGLRLRLRSALLVRGTLQHPSVGIQAGSAVAQTAAAVALGVILSPLASALVFVDPGLAKDADCAGLLAASKTL
jgi:AsmA family protein